MPIVVLADTHLPTRARALPRRLLDELASADLIVHAGDFATVDILTELRRYAPVQAVHGNVDEPELRRILPRRQRVEILGRPVGIIHGDGQIGTTVSRAQAAFAGEAVDLIVFGHSHQPLHRYDGDTLLFNPGSPTDRRLSPRFSYGRISLGPDGRLAAEHVWIEPGDR